MSSSDEEGVETDPGEEDADCPYAVGVFVRLPVRGKV